MLVSPLHHEPAMLLVTEIKFRHGSALGRPLIRRFNGPRHCPWIGVGPKVDPKGSRSFLARQERKAPALAGDSSRHLPKEKPRGPETLGAPMLSQSTNHARRGSRPEAQRLESSHRERRIASIIVTALAAPKILRNKRSPRANARPHPKAASAASASSSRKLGSVQGAFI
jgi:hypothetical protein